jgi:hypothetical protein
MNARVVDISVDSQSNRVTGFMVCHRDADKARFAKMIACDPRNGPTLQTLDPPQPYQVADHYVAAVPVEVMAGFLKENGIWTDLAELAPELKKIDVLKSHTEWMNSIVFYLKGSPTTIAGHSVYVDTPFALSSIFQERHWSAEYPLSGFGAGNLTAICSVIASNWLDTEANDHRIPNGGFGRISGKSAADTIFNNSNFLVGKQKLIEEVWEDLKSSLRIDGKSLLKDANLEFAYIDPAIAFENGKVINREPLLVNRKNSLHLRPLATTCIPNFFLAGDYIKTNTDLATMESACEAGKQAVNGILDQEHHPSRRCAIYPLKRLAAFAALRFIDQLRYKRSRP